jgi:hypothetical protein
MLSVLQSPLLISKLPIAFYEASKESCHLRKLPKFCLKTLYLCLITLELAEKNRKEGRKERKEGGKRKVIHQSLTDVNANGKF